MTNKNSAHTWHLHITGQVQGIGFRPTVYRIAQQFGIVGKVRNEADGLHVVFNASREVADNVKNEICQDALPALARITAIQFTEIQKQEFIGFEIVHGDAGALPNLILTPDVAICQACSQELSNEDNRRDSYSFNSCSQCGPRYSIIDSLPYDRENTKMAPFVMCSSCADEYGNPEDRRYYAQTISCSNCAIALSLYMSNGSMVSADNVEIVDQVSRLWKEGNIIAIKGIGGYLLTCQVDNEEVIERLRKLKYRPTKPFAVMHPNMASLASYIISKEGEEALSNHVSPIVLIPKVKDIETTKGICDGQDHVGVMLPYAPLFKVLLNKLKAPIIATSGNRSNAPIVYKDAYVFEQLSEIADYVLTNNREIVIPQDDSVIKYSEVYNQKIILRRSRGMAPTYIDANLKLEGEPLLATGAQHKSTFSLHQAPNTYISQYLGNLDSYETMESFKHSLQHLTEILKINPTGILSDRHRGYASTTYGHSLAGKWNVPISLIPHHVSHFSAILGEHNLIDDSEITLGVIWDGAGLGDDDCIWGSEFFIFQQLEFTRCAHLSYFDLLLGDKMAKEPRLSALSLAHGLPNSDEILKSKFTKTEWRIYTKKLTVGNHPQTSSMGRLFDAVASIIGLNDKQTFEGEAPMMLEVIARKFYKNNSLSFFQSHYLGEVKLSSNLPVREVIEGILQDLNDGVAKSCIAAKFHLTLIQWIKGVSYLQKSRKIAFSGGVFQNSLLVDLAIEYLSEDHELYFHEQLSPNDENISFGQLIYHQITKKRAENE